MKRSKLLLILLVIFLVTGCTSSMEKELLKDGYTCKNSICTKLENQKEIVETSFTYDLKNKKYLEEKKFITYGDQGYKLEYNWKKKTFTCDYVLPVSSFKIEYDLNDEKSFNCTSKDEDTLYVKAECLNIKSELEIIIENIEETLKQN